MYILAPRVHYSFSFVGSLPINRPVFYISNLFCDGLGAGLKHHPSTWGIRGLSLGSPICRKVAFITANVPSLSVSITLGRDPLPGTDSQVSWAWVFYKVFSFPSSSFNQAWNQVEWSLVCLQILYTEFVICNLWDLWYSYSWPPKAHVQLSVRGKNWHMNCNSLNKGFRRRRKNWDWYVILFQICELIKASRKGKNVQDCAYWMFL